MDRRDRERINCCCETVVSRIDMKKLLPRLLQNKVYNRDDTNMPRWMKNPMAPDIVKDIYLTIKTRGPYAFKSLILSLRQSDHENVADILEGKTSASNTSSDQENNSLDKHLIWSDKPLTIRLRKATRFLDRNYDSCDIIARYPMRSKPRGLVLIIANIYYYSPEDKPRLSAQHDTNNLQTLFEEMGFKVVVYENLTGKEIKDVVINFSRSSDLKNVDSCFVIFTSHGTEDKHAEDKENNTEIQGTDYSSASGQTNYEKVMCTDICDYFTAEACPQLAEKPKIFIFQLCRGKRKQKAIAHSRTAIDTIPMDVIPNTNNYEQSHISNISRLTTRNYSDMLIVQSTLPGHVSYRDQITGSWFIHYLCSTFMNYACTTHIQDLFTMVDAELKMVRTGNDECQTPSIQLLGFSKHCYLNPGLFES
ncbi:caspase Dronc-like isoform X1 [Formica exsecta]|uniref:caspase Dronc-like isoform X1 n=2 Tax=Formica exsecta TaxID=72781 RepID=UPI0011433E26|nr:caspase Dronc-like isoform X1 [Formica exsecta]